MKDVTMPLGKRQDATGARAELLRPASPPWWIVFLRELADMWIGGKALVLIFIYCLLLGIMAYVLASNSELSLIPPKEMVFLTLQTALSIGGFIAVIVGADSISGERERATLEALLLTPASRFQIVAGKFLAAISPWPAAMLITIPYLHVLSQGDEVFSQSLYWGFLFGSLLSLGYTSLGMLASIWSNSNRTSFGVSLVIYLICALPVQFPGNAQTGTMGRVLKAVNPMAATDHFLEKVLVNNRTQEELTNFIISPIAFPILILAILFVYAAPRLRLEGGAPFTYRPKWVRAAGLFLAASLLSALNAYPAMAAPPVAPVAQDTATVVQLPLEISIDTTAKVVKNGDPIFFNTTVTNNGADSTPPLIVAMNIINLNGDGDPVDPEDWSPERTQYLDTLAPGQSAKHAWRLNTILEGDYMLYMVLVPTPNGPEETSWPHTSAGMHVTVERYVRTNPGGVLPYAIGGPVVLLIGILLIYRYRRWENDSA
jgi:ABC-type transport system involved in multi-copper enzyme maturation permease subunit